MKIEVYYITKHQSCMDQLSQKSKMEDKGKSTLNIKKHKKRKRTYAIYEIHTMTFQTGRNRTGRLLPRGPCNEKEHIMFTVRPTKK